jgi:hypothetical protein
MQVFTLTSIILKFPEIQPVLQENDYVHVELTER